MCLGVVTDKKVVEQKISLGPVSYSANSNGLKLAPHLQTWIKAGRFFSLQHAAVVDVDAIITGLPRSFAQNAMPCNFSHRDSTGKLRGQSD